MENKKIFTGQVFSFQYPENGQVVEFNRPDGPFVVRVMQTLEGIQYSYDLEKLASTAPAKDLAAHYFVHSIEQPEDLAPEKVEVNGFDAWHTRKVFFDGLRAVLIFEAYFISKENANYRLQYLAPTTEYKAGLSAFQDIVNSFHFN